jgi:hypothetical protein
MSVLPLNSSLDSNSFSTIKESQMFLLENNQENFDNSGNNNASYSNLAPEIQKIIKDSKKNNNTFPAIDMKTYDKYTKQHHKWFPNSENTPVRQINHDYSSKWDVAGDEYTQNNSNKNDELNKNFVMMEEGKTYKDVDPLNKYQPQETTTIPHKNQYHYVNIKDKNLYYYDQSTDSLIKIGQKTSPMKLLNDPNAYTLDNMSEEKLLELKHGKVDESTQEPPSELKKQLNTIANKLNNTTGKTNDTKTTKTNDKINNDKINNDKINNEKIDNKKSDDDKYDIYIIIGAYIISGISFLIMLGLIIYNYFK